MTNCQRTIRECINFLRHVNIFADLLNGGILGSRIPDIFSGKSGHFCRNYINGIIFYQIMKINVTNTPKLKGIGHNMAYIYLIVTMYALKQ